MQILKRIFTKKSKNFLERFFPVSKYSTETSNVDKKLHEPVMLNEILTYLVDEPKDFKVYLDLTFGAGGHSEAILQRNINSIVYTSDRDPVAFELAKKMSQKYP